MIYEGENLYMITGSSYSDSDLGDKASSSWYSEIEDYEYPSDPAQTFDLCVDFEDVGHFTQVKRIKHFKPVNVNTNKKCFPLLYKNKLCWGEV